MWRDVYNFFYLIFEYGWYKNLIIKKCYCFDGNFELFLSLNLNIFFDRVFKIKLKVGYVGINFLMFIKIF